MIYVTADEHFFHRNIIKYTGRPFSDVVSMNNAIIENVNSVLVDGDHLYHLGDFMLGRASQLERFYKLMKMYKDGITHHLILGNHDMLKPNNYIDIGFTSVHTSIVLDREHYTFVLAHDPSIRCAIPDNYWLLHGHIHTLYHFLKEKRAINVGVDVYDYFPVSINDIELFVMRKETL